jgi:acetyltransferase-like isoleucine patch superfamily enzyme
VLSTIATALRALRFRLWALGVRARLKRLGCDLTLEVAGTPRFFGLPRLEAEPVGGARGSLTLRIGRGCKLGRELIIDVWTGTHGVIEIGERVTFQNRVRLQPWGGAIRLGDGVQIRDHCELKSKGELTLGERAILGRNVTLHCDTRIALGAKVGLAERVTVSDSDHANDGSDTFFMEQPVIADPVTFDDNAFVGTNVVVLRGSHVGRNVVVGAGAVLTGGEYPAGWVIVGVPARALKPLPAAPAAREDAPAAG